MEGKKKKLFVNFWFSGGGWLVRNDYFWKVVLGDIKF